MLISRLSNLVEVATYQAVASRPSGVENASSSNEVCMFVWKRSGNMCCVGWRWRT